MGHQKTGTSKFRDEVMKSPIGKIQACELPENTNAKQNGWSLGFRVNTELTSCVRFFTFQETSM